MDATDAEKLAVSVSAFKAPAANAAVTANIALPATVVFGTVAWTSSNTAVISISGVVTRPAVGQPDVAVTLSYVITVGTLSSDSVAIEFTVKAEEPVIVVPTADLFFSEYIEGSSNNKAIEIYNPTSAAVDLSQYSVANYPNGSSTAIARPLTGTLAAGDVYVISSNQAIQGILDQADLQLAYSATEFACNWNGDDAVGLLKGSTVIDVIGVIGVDPGTNWPVGTASTVDYTLVRNSGISYGNTTFTASEWTALAKDTISSLGAHTA